MVSRAWAIAAGALALVAAAMFGVGGRLSSAEGLESLAAIAYLVAGATFGVWALAAAFIAAWTRRRPLPRRVVGGVVGGVLGLHAASFIVALTASEAYLLFRLPPLGALAYFGVAPLIAWTTVGSTLAVIATIGGLVMGTGAGLVTARAKPDA